MTTPRQRVIDDTDPAIEYGPNGWFVANPSTLTAGNFGPVYNGTSHAASSNATLNFAFNGTSMRVYGTIMVSTDSNNVTDPTWDCFVDEIQISNPQPTFKFPENNWVLCDQPQISTGAHVLRVEVQSKGKTFYLDDLVYTPLPDETFESAVLIYPNTDPSIAFGGGWSNIGNQENATQTAGAQVSLFFYGTSASLFGFTPTELPHNATSASYTIDGDPSTSFALNGLSSPNSATSYNNIYFQTPTLPSGPHNLVVTHGGDNQHTPLIVEGFYVTSATALASNSSSSTTPPVTTSDTPSASPPKHSSAGAIAGGVIGGLILLALVAGLVIWYRRRRGQIKDEATSANPYPMSTADGDAPPIALPASGNPYAYSPVSAVATGTRTSGTRSDVSRPSTTHPYIHRAAPLHQHPSDTMSSPTRTHTHQLSSSAMSHGPATSASGSHVPGTSYSSNNGGLPPPTGSLDAMVSHGSFHNPLPTPQATPPASSKLAREMAAAAAYLPPVQATQEPGTRVLRHEDSGLRLPPSSAPEPEIVELPPGYSPD
ncbi:hypothetical protein B0H17DRAFT_1069637 [Mycena rosella]|uniref:Uncharacterized protein n=1 Tax=Mycena rosella TaxID=1033263 RepID=A0AAD7DD22_MYCRO|nr:hypothetical protein B0H17DRAFT_1069637 [Mycena rosella]